MSYNANDPNQQWQPPVNPNQQQQQVQSFNQQATPNSTTPGGGNYQQNQQSYSWTDGNTQGQHTSTQQSWSWQGQTTTPMIQSPPAFPAMPMLNQGASHQQFHQQMHQNAMAHHQNAMNTMHQNMASMMSNMTPMMQQTPLQPQITYQTVSPQPQIAWQQNVVQSPQQQAQIAYQPSQLMSPGVQVPQPANSYQQGQIQQQGLHNPLPISPMAAQPQLQYTQNIYQQTQSQQSPSSQAPTVQNPYPQALQQQPLAQQRPQITYIEQPSQSQQSVQQRPQQPDQGDRFQDLEKQRKKDLENMNRAGSEINKRLQELEQSKTRAQTDQQAKDHEVRKLKEQLASVERQRRQDAERNSKQLADLVRSQATSPPAQTPAFDMGDLQKVIQGMQSQQLSGQDIERVIGEQVNKRLSGMATKADIQNAGAQMQNALNQVPAGLNEAQVQQAVNREFNNVIQDVANRVNQQRRIAGPGNRAPQSGQIPQDRVQTEFVIEELPDEGSATQPPNPGYNSSAQRALPSAGHNNTGSAIAPRAVAQTSSSMPLQRPAASMQPSGRSQYPAIEGNSLQAPQRAESGRTQPLAIGATPTVSASTATVQGRPNSHTQAASRGPQLAVLGAPPVAPTVPGNALALADRSTSANGSASPGTMPQQQNIAYAQPRPTPTHLGSTNNISMPPRVQMQLEAAPSNGQQLEMARTQPVNLQNQGTAQTAAQPQQGGGIQSQRQLEAPPAQYSTTSQELVHQSRDVARKGHGR
jgi:hypothetical protein